MAAQKVYGAQLKRWFVCCALIVLSTFAQAQSTDLIIAAYAKTGTTLAQSSMQLRFGSELQPESLSYGAVRSTAIPASASQSFELLRTGSTEVLARADAAIEAGRSYMLLATGDGRVQPFQLQLIASQSAATSLASTNLRLINAALLPGDSTATAIQLRIDSDAAQTLAQAAHGQISEASLVNRSLPLTVRAVTLGDGHTAVHLKQRSMSGKGATTLVIHGEAGALRVDEIQIEPFIFHYANLNALAIGPFSVRFLNGGALPAATTTPAALRIGALGTSAAQDLGYGEFSGTFILPEEGAYRFGASVLLGGNPIPDLRALSDVVELDGGRNYIVVAKSWEFNEYVGTLAGTDPTPFLIVEESPAPVGGTASLRIHHAATIDRDPVANLLSVRFDDGRALGTLLAAAELRPSATAGQALTVPVTANLRTDLKISNTDGTRNFADAAPFTLAAGEAVDAFVIGDGKVYPFRLVALQRSLAAEGAVDYTRGGIWTIAGRPFEGFNLTPRPKEDRLVGTWFGHSDSDGSQRWYAFDSCQSPAGASQCNAPASFDNSHATLSVYRTAAPGGTSTPTLVDAGTLQIEFTSCLSARATAVFPGMPTQSLELLNQTPGEGCH